jgi:outer membrane protein TolC
MILKIGAIGSGKHQRAVAFICFHILFFLVLGPCFAQQDESTPTPPSPIDISPNKAVEMAIDNNLGLKQTILNSEAKRRAAQTPWNVFIPTIDLSGTLGRLNVKPAGMVLPLPPALGGPINVGAGNQWVLMGSLQLSLNINIGTFMGMKQTIEEYEAGKITIEKAKLQLERDVRKAYFQLLLAKEQIALLRGSAENMDRQVAMAQANYRGGLIPEVNLLQVQVARENLKPQIDEAENMYRIAMASFALYLGLPYDAEFNLEPLPGEAEFIVLETQDLISKAAANKPEIEELRRTLSALQAQKTALFYNLFTPTLSLAFNMDPTFNGDPMKDSWFKGDAWKQQQGMFRITLAWRLNALIPFTKENQAWLAMNDTLKAMDLGMAQTVQTTKTEVYNIIMQLEKTRTTAEAQKLTVDLAERTLRLTERAYGSGYKQYLEVLNDELALRQARLGVLQQNYNYLMGLLDLEYAIGVPFGTLGGRK